MFFIPISTGKRYTNFGQNGGEIWEIVEIGIDMYILDQEKKIKLFQMNESSSSHILVFKLNNQFNIS